MYRIYQVEYGDTLDKIANKVGSSPNDIKTINGFNSDADLIVGSLIVVPKEENQVFSSYKVKKGDSIYSISKMFDISPDTLLLINGLNKDEYIYPGQDLMIPNSNYVVYVTKDGDTLDAIIKNFRMDANTLNSENERIFVMPDQLIVHKKGKNN